MQQHTLEERVQEIELLNRSLRERLQEIESANYKIADLASELESKNTTLAQAVQRLSLLYKMGLALNSTMDLSRLFNLLLRMTVDALSARAGYLLMYDEQQQILGLADAVGLPAEVVDNLGPIPLQPGGTSFWVISNKQPLLIKNIDEEISFRRRSTLGFDRQTVICAPLLIQDRVIGTITMANKTDESNFTREDLELLSTIAAQASVAIRNARLYEEQESSYLGTVQALVSAIEANDAYTRGHSERVTRFSLALARAMGLPTERIKRLEQAAILHDIGKIGIEPSLLNKIGALSPHEIQTLRQHPRIGMRILEPIRFLEDVSTIIGQHHEHFDAHGYPHGLGGEKILLEARILAVADAFDALTTDRPYRKAIGAEAALIEISRKAGSQFDPQVVATLQRLRKGTNFSEEVT